MKEGNPEINMNYLSQVGTTLDEPAYRYRMEPDSYFIDIRIMNNYKRAKQDVMAGKSMGKVLYGEQSCIP